MKKVAHLLNEDLCYGCKLELLNHGNSHINLDVDNKYTK